MLHQAFTHFLFVDMENVPVVDMGMIEGTAVHVTLLIGKNQSRMDLALVRQIHRLSAQVELVEVGASGRNALDLTLACYLGRAIERVPGAEFAVISKDRDFVPMIAHLRGWKVNVERYDNLAALPFLRPLHDTVPLPESKPRKAAAGTAHSAPDRRAKVLARLKNSSTRNRPSNEKTLLRHIKTALGKNGTDTEAADIVREARESGYLDIDSRGRVSYAAPD